MRDMPQRREFLLSFAGVATQGVFRTGTTLVHVDVQVTKDGEAVTGLTAADFVIKENRKAREIVHFAREEQPLDLVLLLDLSGSMRKSIGQLAAGARGTAAQLKSGDRVAVVPFNQFANLAQTFTDDRVKVEAALTRLVAEESVGGPTDLYGATQDVAELIQRSARQDSRRAIVMVTDGIGKKTAPEKEVISALWRADAVLGVVAVETPFDPTLLPPEWRLPENERAALRPLVEATGGELVIDVEAADRALGRMLDRLRRRYGLYYKPDPGQPGEIRRIQVELTKETRRRVGQVQVRARSGYVL
jgi:VWFA-related protein